MSWETSKCSARRFAQGHIQKLIGQGLDVGAGEDVFRPVAGVCRPWDRKYGDGDAAKLEGIAKGSLDYIYSSHCLEHLADPIKVLKCWADVVKKDGYLYVVVPDYDLYEGGQGIRNRFHKAAFTLRRESDPKLPLYNVIDLLRGALADRLAIRYIGLCDDNYDEALAPTVDQTLRGAVCHIEFMAQKI
jgi:SAM-dependent methyltransferase